MSMNSVEMSSITFAFAFGGAIVGMLLRTTLPEHHRNSDSKDAVKVTMALVSTMSALVLGSVSYTHLTLPTILLV